MLEVLFTGLAVVVLVPAAVLFMQVLMAMPAHRDREIPPGNRPGVAVLVPAHNEASGIAHTLSSIIPQLAEGDRLLVVADNCTDDTARIAAAAGAEVIERADAEHRGKGYALDFGVRYLERQQPEVVVVIDADCQVGVDTIDRLARLCGQTFRPVQALYLMTAPEGAGLTTHIAEFAWLVKNFVRPLGYQRLGLPCQLMGTGMALPWSVISSAALASKHIAEDLMLGISLTRSGMPPLFCPEALVKSVFPGNAQGIQTQRTRWEHGHLGMILVDAPRLFAVAIAHGNVNLTALVIDLCVPPLALLMLLASAVLAASSVFFAATKIALPLSLAATALVLFGSAVLLAWSRFGRQVISLRSLACAPFYVLWKMPVYLTFLVKRQAEWVRSRRDGD